MIPTSEYDYELPDQAIAQHPVEPRDSARLLVAGSLAAEQQAVGTVEHRTVADLPDLLEPGDLLVSSGLGGRFPVGYPVAVVSEIERDPGQSFARIHAVPTATLDRSRHVLLVFTTNPSQEN